MPFQPVNVPIGFQDQIVPNTQGPIGRLISLINARIRKFRTASSGPITNNIETRPGFQQLATPVFDQQHNALTTQERPQYLFTHGDQLCRLNDSKPQRYSKEQQSWYQQPFHIIPTTIQSDTLYADVNPAYLPHSAVIGTVRCYTYQTTNPATGTQVVGRDSEGTVLWQFQIQPFVEVPFLVARSKVVADGTNFWVFQSVSVGDNGHELYVSVYSPAGVLVAQLNTESPIEMDPNPIGPGPASAQAGWTSPWDVNFDPFQGVTACWVDVTAGVKVAQFSISGSSVVQGTTTTIAAQFPSGMNFLTGIGDGNSYVALMYGDGYGAPVIGTQTWQFNSILGNAQTYPFFIIPVDPLVGSQVPVNVTGYPLATGVGPTLNMGFAILNGSLAVGISPDLTSLTTWYSVTASAATHTTTFRSVTLASKAFQLAGKWQALHYYASLSEGDPNSALSGRQPTYVCYSLEDFQPTGRIFWGFAAFDCQRSFGQTGPIAGIAQGCFHLSAVMPDVDGNFITALPTIGITAAKFQSETITVAASTTTTATGGTQVINSLTSKTLLGEQHTTSITELRFLAPPSENAEVALRPTTISGETFLPGPVATHTAGNVFAESGIYLDPEPLNTTQEATNLQTITVPRHALDQMQGSAQQPIVAAVGDFIIPLCPIEADGTAPFAINANSPVSGNTQITVSVGASTGENGIIFVGKTLGLVQEVFVSGQITIGFGTFNSNQGSWAIASVTHDLDGPSYVIQASDTLLFTTTAIPNAVSDNTFSPPKSIAVSLSPAGSSTSLNPQPGEARFANGLGGAPFDGSYIGANLTIAGNTTAPANNGSFPITGIYEPSPGNTWLQILNPTSTFQSMIVPLPTVSIVPTAPLTITLNNADFDPTFVNGVIYISGAAHPNNNTPYRILTVVDSHNITVLPLQSGGQGGGGLDPSGATVYNEAFGNAVTFHIILTGNQLTPGVAYQYALTEASRNERGDLVETAWYVQAQPVLYNGLNNATAINWPSDRITTRKTFWRIWRTGYTGTFPTDLLDSGVFREITDPLNPLLNNPAVDLMTFTDSTSDIAIQSAAQLYNPQAASGGELPNDPCPPYSTGVVWLGYLFVVGYDNAIYRSKSKTEGRALAFNIDVLRFPTTDALGKIVRLAVVDDHLWIYTDKNEQFFLSSTGPDDTGNGNPIPSLQRVTFSLDCNGFGLVIGTGDVIQTSKGKWLSGRGVLSDFIGAPVIDQESFPAITGANIDTLAIFQAATNDMLCYDSINRGWYTWVPQEGSPAVSGTAWVGPEGVLTYVWVDSQSRVWYQTQSVYDDGATGVTKLIQFAPISGTTPLGYMRCKSIQFFGTWNGAHMFNVALTYDNAGLYPESWTADYTVNPGAYQPEVPITNETFESITITITDSFAGSGSASFSLEAMVMDISIKSGLYRNPITQRMLPGT